MRLLSARVNITELQVKGDRSGSCPRNEYLVRRPTVSRDAQIITLQSITPLMHHIKTLVLDDAILLLNIATDIQQLAAAAPDEGWKLQRLTLHASCPSIDTDTLTLERTGKVSALLAALLMIRQQPSPVWSNWTLGLHSSALSVLTVVLR